MPDPDQSALEEIRRAAEHRLLEIAPLIEEAARLREVLAVTEQHSQPAARTMKIDQGGETHARRAPKGANKHIILELVARRPGITPAEISRLTGLKRTVAASTVSRLKRCGELEAHGQGVRVAAKATLATVRGAPTARPQTAAPL